MIDVNLMATVLMGVFFGTLLAWFARFVLVYTSNLLLMGLRFLWSRFSAGKEKSSGGDHVNDGRRISKKA